MRWCSIGMGWLLLLLAGATTAGAQIFPAEITFQVKNGLMQGSFKVGFSEALTGSRYTVVLRDFGGLGMKSSQELWSYVAQDDLSLYGHEVKERDGQVIREVFLDRKCSGAMGRDQTTCFIYKEYESGDSTQTEIFAKGHAIDLVSSILVTTRLAATGVEDTSDFVFIFEDSAKKVSLVPLGPEKLKIDGHSVSTTVWSMRPRGDDYELYRFYIAQEEKGFFPVKMVIVDPERGSMVSMAKRWSW